MAERIEVRSQAEFDACVKAGNIAIVIGCRIVARGNASVVARGNASVVAWGNASVEARENASVVAWGNASVEAWGNASVEARENASVVARENASVEARENASVVAWGNVFVRLFSARRIRASAFVTIIRHGDAKEIYGGRQLDAAQEPKTGAEFCDFNGIDPATADYRVVDLDQRILAQIENKPDSFDMGIWHEESCDETNWCETAHCRAGFAICMAGKAGFDLEKKYGAELAGRMIYAVSRPEMELPDFFVSDEDALEDIRRSAAKQ